LRIALEERSHGSNLSGNYLLTRLTSAWKSTNNSKRRKSPMLKTKPTPPTADEQVRLINGVGWEVTQLKKTATAAVEKADHIIELLGVPSKSEGEEPIQALLQEILLSIGSLAERVERVEYNQLALLQVFSQASEGM
jgi:hypothetical protein